MQYKQTTVKQSIPDNCIPVQLPSGSAVLEPQFTQLPALSYYGTQVCSVLLALCNPKDCSPPGSSSHGPLQERTLSGLPFPSPGDLPDPGMELVSPATPALAGAFFHHSAMRETHMYFSNLHTSGSTQFKSVLLMGQLYYRRKHC